MGRFRRFIADPVFAIALTLVLAGLGALNLLSGRTAAVAAFALALVVLIAWLSDWVLRSRRAALREQCRRLSEEILQFLGDRRRDDPGMVPHWHGLGPNATEEEKNRAFNESTSKMLQHSTDTLARYNERYLARTIALFDALDKRSLIDKSKRPYFEHPTNPLGMEEVARTLGAFGHGSD